MIMLNNPMAPSPWQPLNGQGVRRISSLNVRADESREGGVLKVCTVNVGTMVGRGREMVDMLARRNIDICCVQEVRYKGDGARTFGVNEEKYKLWYSGGREGLYGVGIMVRQELVDNVLKIERFSDRLIKIRLVLGKQVFNIFSLYAPQAGRPQVEKEEFIESLEEEIARSSLTEGLIVAGDVNAHIGVDRNGYEEVMGPYGYGDRNAEGERFLSVFKNHDLKVMNTFFKKDIEKRITYKSGNTQTQIDLIMVRLCSGARMRDCKTFPGEPCLTQHRAVCGVLMVKFFKRKIPLGPKRLRTWKLKKNHDSMLAFQGKLNDKLNDCNGSWSRFSSAIEEVCEEVCGKTSGRRARERETWWWSGEVQEAIKLKRVAFKRWQNSGFPSDKALYVRERNRLKRAITRSKKEAWAEFSQTLTTSEGRNNMYKLSKQMRKDRTDLVGGKYVIDTDNNLKIAEEEIRDTWRKYYLDLLNVENPSEIEEVVPVSGPLLDVSLEEVKGALKVMKSGRGAGPSGVTSDLFKMAGETALQELVKIFNGILDGNAPEEWKRSITVPLYKGKGDPLQCGNYRGLRLLEHGMKLWEKVLCERLKMVTNVDESQFGFTPGKSTTDAIFCLRHLQSMHLEKKRQLFHIFVDLEKAFDRIPRTAIRWALRRQRVPERLIAPILNLYESTTSKVAVAGGLSEDFPIEVGVHQGSILSPLLFIIVMEEAARDCRGLAPWEMLYADDLVITGVSREAVSERFIAWKEALEKRGLRINMSKTKFMISGREREVVRRGRFPCGVCGDGVGVNSILCSTCERWCHRRCSGLTRLSGVANFQCPACVNPSSTNIPQAEPLQVEGQEIELVNSFCYLGDMLSCDGGCVAAVRTRVACAWSKWRELAGLLNMREIPLLSRAAVYDACIRSVLLYSSETWAVTKKLEDEIRGCDRRMLRFMAGVKLRDRVTSAEILERCGLKDILKVLQVRRLRWFGHVKRRDPSEVLGRVLNMTVEGRRPPGRPKKNWLSCVQEDLRSLNISEEDVHDRRRWEQIIKTSNLVTGNIRR